MEKEQQREVIMVPLVTDYLDISYDEFYDFVDELSKIGIVKKEETSFRLHPHIMEQIKTGKYHIGIPCKPVKPELEAIISYLIIYVKANSQMVKDEKLDYNYKFAIV